VNAVCVHQAANAPIKMLLLSDWLILVKESTKVAKICSKKYAANELRRDFFYTLFSVLEF
jgi:hypothetical protein